MKTKGSDARKPVRENRLLLFFVGMIFVDFEQMRPMNVTESHT